MSGERVHCLNLDRVETYEAGASILTLLAYPEGPEAKRAEVHASLCAQFLRRTYASDPELAVSPATIKPIYFLRGERDIDRDLRTLERRHRDRLVAGRMAMPFVQDAAGLQAGL